MSGGNSMPVHPPGGGNSTPTYIRSSGGASDAPTHPAVGDPTRFAPGTLRIGHQALDDHGWFEASDGRKIPGEVFGRFAIAGEWIHINFERSEWEWGDGSSWPWGGLPDRNISIRAALVDYIEWLGNTP